MQAVQQTPEQQVVDRIKKIIDQARVLYGVDLSTTKISFNLRGRVAGWAICRKDRYTGRITELKVKINHDMLHRESFDSMLNETVPHEMAHLVCFVRPDLGSGHDSGWAAICEAFGGNGERLHENQVVFGRGNTYEFVTDRGVTVRLNERWLKLLSAGVPANFKKGKGTVHPGSTYYIVGQNGRSLATKLGPFTNKTCAVNVSGTVQAQPGNPPVKAFIPAPAVQRPVVARPAPSGTNGPAVQILPGESKASISRKIMRAWYDAGRSYEEIIAEMQRVNGYDRQLARGTFKANCGKIGVPQVF